MLLRISLSVCALLPLAGPAASQTAVLRGGNAGFIESREQSQRLGAAQLTALGAADDLAAIRKRLAPIVPVRVNYVFRDPAERRQIHRQNIEAIAQFLVATGYRGQDLRGHCGGELARSAVRAILGDRRKGDLVRVAPTVILADKLETVVDPVIGKAPRFSSIRYRVVESLKNGPTPGTVIEVPGGPVHYADGTMSGSTFDLQIASPGRYLLLLSRPKATLFARGSLPANRYARLFSGFRLDRGQLQPLGESDEPAPTLKEVRAAIRSQQCELAKHAAR